MINVVLQKESFDHLDDQMGTVSNGEPHIGVPLDDAHARHIHGALTLALGALSPQPAELAGQAVAQMVREGNAGALRRLRTHISEQLEAMGAE